MKKIILASLVSFLVATTILAQPMLSKMEQLWNQPWVIMKDGHACVDLGLPSGNLWAMCNIGADSPIESGSFFAWGETKPKLDYSWDTYFDTNDQGATFIEYNTDGASEQFHYNLKLKNDAAYVNWGGGWMTPDSDTFNEIIKNCCTVFTTDYYGVTGWIFFRVKREEDRGIMYPINFSEKLPSIYDYHKDPHIFLPHAGHMCGNSILTHVVTCGAYMIREFWVYDEESKSSLALCNHASYLSNSVVSKYIGQSVRAVWYKNKPNYYWAIQY